jgi:hypothetical protein
MNLNRWEQAFAPSTGLAAPSAAARAKDGPPPKNSTGASIPVNPRTALLLPAAARQVARDLDAGRDAGIQRRFPGQFAGPDWRTWPRIKRPSGGGALQDRDFSERGELSPGRAQHDIRTGKANLRGQAREVRPVNTTFQQDAVQGEEHVALAGESSEERGCGEELTKRSSGYQIRQAQSIISE